MEPSLLHQAGQRSVACQTDNLELDEATLRNELAMSAYLEILGVLDDDRQPVYHDLGEAYANKVFLQAMDEDPAIEDGEGGPVGTAASVGEETPQASLTHEFSLSVPANTTDLDQCQQVSRLRSLESEVIEAEWSLRCKLAQVRETAKHPVQRWLEGALPTTASASPFASRTPSVHHHHHLHQRHLSATASHCSRPSSVAGLSEVFVSDSYGDDVDEEPTDEAAAAATAGATDAAGFNKSEMTFYSCAVHGVEVPESFIRIKVKGGGTDIGCSGGVRGNDSESQD